MASERSELLRSAFLANIGANYHPDQLIFIDKSAKDKYTLNRHYGYASINTHACKSIVFIHKNYAYACMSIYRCITIMPI